MVDIKNILKENVVKDLDSLELYLNLINEYKNKEIDDNTYCENHHICPKSMYPEYRLSKWNIVKLPFEKHIEAHRLLCLIYQTGEMKRAYSFISRHNYDEKIKLLTSGAFVGDKNPSKHKEVREKISKSKKGKKRPDMLNTKFFGASEEVYINGIKKMKEKLSETVIVRDKDGNKFRVSIYDQRYISGELVPFNLGVKKENSASKRKDVMENIMKTRNDKYEKISKFSYEEMVEYLLDAHNSGKNIFKKDKFFGSNYIMLINKTNFNREDLYNSVVQRLSKVPN